MKTDLLREMLRRPFLTAAALVVLLQGCFLVSSPEDRVEAFLRAAYEGDGLAIQDMLLMRSKDDDFLTMEEWLTHWASEKGEAEAKQEITEEQLQSFREEYDAQVAKASLDLVERGPLKAVESTLIERNEKWACVQAVYRFADGSTLAKDQYGDKKAMASRFAPDGYYFLLRQDGRWYILDSVPDFAAQRFSITTAGALLEALINGNVAEVRKLMAVPAPGQTGESDPLSGITERSPEEKNLLSGWSLQFRGRRENKRVTVVSFEVRVMDAEQKAQTEEIAVTMRLRDGLWEVDRSDVASAANAVGGLTNRLEGIRQAKIEREMEAERQARLQPVVLLDQVRSIRSSWLTPGMDYSFRPPSAGRLRLDLQVLDGVPLLVELMPPEEYQALRSASREYKSYLAFRGEDVIRQSFEMPVVAGVEYVLFIRPNEVGEATNVELKYWFLPEG